MKWISINQVPALDIQDKKKKEKKEKTKKAQVVETTAVVRNDLTI